MAKEEKEKKIDYSKMSLNEMIKELNKEFGPRSVVKVTDTTKEKVDVIPTGSFSLDLALGVGGFPRGRIVEIFGPEAGGKTTLALTTVANAQKAGGVAAYIDVECAFDPAYAETIGVKNSELLLSQPDSAEEALNIAERYASSGKVDVIVVDSVAALEPKAESEGNIGDQSMAVKARLMSQALRSLTPKVFKSNCLLIFINQIRMNIGGYGNPEVTPGGNALKFHCSVRLDVRRSAFIKDGEDVIGISVRAKVAKNKVAPPYKAAEFSLMFGEGISYEVDVFNIAVLRGIIEKSGNTYLFGKEKLGVGMKKAIAYMKEHKELTEKVATKIKEQNDTDEKK